MRPDLLYANPGEAMLAGQRALGIDDALSGVTRRPRYILAYGTTPAWCAWGGEQAAELAGGLEVTGYVVQVHGDWVFIYDVEQV